MPNTYTFTKDGAMLKKQDMPNKSDDPARRIPRDTQNAVLAMQSPKYRQWFSPQVNADALLEGLTNVCSQYELSVGLIDKFLLLKNRHLNFIIDNSVSMDATSDVLFEEAHSALRTNYSSLPMSKRKHLAQLGENELMMTRWGETENRLHIMIDFLAYIPTESITISLLNDQNGKFNVNDEKQTISADMRKSCTPEEFKKMAHNIISRIFQREPYGLTPLKQALHRAFKSDEHMMMHYVLTDGEPSDCSTKNLAELITTRGLLRSELHKISNKANRHPVNLISCTNEDLQYFKEIDKNALYVDETDDYIQEKREVLNAQGETIPFTKGLWILCQLVGALDKDLDNLDEKKELSLEFLSKLLGRNVTAADYDYYKMNHPNYLLSDRASARSVRTQSFFDQQPDTPRRSPHENNQQHTTCDKVTAYIIVFAFVLLTAAIAYNTDDDDDDYDDDNTCTIS